MSQGPLLQLLAVGSQDLYLINNPQVSFWRSVYRRHTNFAFDDISQTLQGTCDFGRKITAQVTRNGDLISNGFIRFDLPALTPNAGSTVAWTRHLGHNIFQYLTLEIGGGTIETTYGTLMNVWAQLTIPEDKRDGYAALIGDISALTTQDTAIPPASLFVPLPFFFCSNPGLALPVVALMYHDIRINMQLRNVGDLVISGDGNALGYTPSLTNMDLSLRYVFLEGAERKVFSQASHEYLIATWQWGGEETANTSSYRQKLSFSHPTQELVWCFLPEANILNNANRWSDYTMSGSSDQWYQGSDVLNTARILLNTTERVSVQPAAYYNLLIPFWHHTRVPAKEGIYVYSFALNPEQHQPSGSCNFSRLENVSLDFSLNTGTSNVRIYTYARSFNIFRVISGMGGSEISQESRGQKSITPATLQVM
jgi:hypothetical protein